MLGPFLAAVKGTGRPRWILLARWSWGLVLLAACGAPSSSPPTAIPVTASPGTLPASPTAASNRAASNQAAREYWDACYFDNVKVGSTHQQYQPRTENGTAIVEITAKSELNLRRFGQSVSQIIEMRSIETAAGEVLRVESQMTSAGPDGKPLTIATHGQVVGNQLKLDISTLGKTVPTSLPWEKSWGGFFAMEQNLERQPMKVGEKRAFRALQAGFNQIADIQYEAIHWEPTRLIDESRELLRINAKIKIADVTLEQTVWMDETGKTLKSYMPALKQTSYRTTRENAEKSTTEAFDLGERMTVPIGEPFDKPHQTRRATYRVSLESGDPAESFALGATQYVRKLDEHTIELHVRALRPTDDLGTEFPRDQPPQDEDRAPNALIQSDDSLIVQMADSIAPGKTDFWEVATALEKHVEQHVTTKNFSQALASAADVVRSGEGDCTEHAVLLAALCRAKRIPARVAIGLVYFQAARGFAYHMWTEAWSGDRWVPLDATLGRGGIGAAHLKITSSSLQGADALSQFLPVFKLIGNVKIKLVSYE